MLPPLPRHSADRNRTSPFAFTGNKFEFRALGSSMSPGMTNTILNTIVAEAIDDLVPKLEAALKSTKDLEKAVLKVVKETYNENKRIMFGGDGYSQDWHDEAKKRGLLNLPTTPDALPQLVEEISRSRCSKSTKCSPSGSSTHALRSIRRAVLRQAQHRGRDGRLACAHDAPTGRPCAIWRRS